MQTQHKQREKERSATARRSKQTTATTRTTITTLASAPAVAQRVDDLTEHEAALVQATTAAERLAALIGVAQLAEARVRRCRARAQALRQLTAPPELAEVSTLATLRLRIGRGVQYVARLRQLARALAPLPPPLQLADTAPLQRAVGTLHRIVRAAHQSRIRRAALATLPVPPVPEDATPMTTLLGRLRAATKRRDVSQTNCRQTGMDTDAAAEAVRSACATEGVCPTCGGPIDADRLLSRPDEGTSS